MKKYILTLPVIFSIISPMCAYVYGDQMNRADRSCVERCPVKCPEKCKEPCVEGSGRYYNKNLRDKCCIITPPTNPDTSCSAAFFLTADFIWWKAEEDGLGYAFNGLSDRVEGAGASINASKGKVRHPHFKYEPGFKVGAGMKFGRDGWDLYAQYTWLRNNNSHSSVSRSDTGASFVMSDIFSPQSLNAHGAGENGLIAFDAVSASAKWKLHFNVIDLELGRDFWISPKLTLRPFIGMKFTWLDQKFRVSYNQIFDGDVSTFSETMHFKETQFGVGIRTGINTAWWFCKNWAIYGDFAATGLWNDFDSSRKDHFFNGLGGDQTIFNVSNDSKKVTAVLEWGLELRWETTFNCDKFLFLLQAGWEQQVWFSQNQFMFAPSFSAGDLNLQGLTVKAGFYF